MATVRAREKWIKITKKGVHLKLFVKLNFEIAVAQKWKKGITDDLNFEGFPNSQSQYQMVRAGCPFPTLPKNIKFLNKVKTKQVATGSI